ncbi:hypothetical protein QBC41DRAFT_350386 [Cercophora samala]|uniref:Uncharacterized protein n=1 Tax=Cercophora samala TaxID=330535 RepID=A0AA40D479_9PEZI|nr:hypothetical protein QBC41DRAFT_350386 [Cercophora samala]
MDILEYFAGGRAQRPRAQQPPLGNNRTDARRADPGRRGPSLNNRLVPDTPILPSEADQPMEASNDPLVVPTAGETIASPVPNPPDPLAEVLPSSPSTSGVPAVNNNANTATADQIPPAAGQGSSLEERVGSLANILTLLVHKFAEQANAPVPLEASAAGPVEASAQEQTRPPGSQVRNETTRASPQADKTSSGSASPSTGNTQLPMAFNEPRRASTEPSLPATRSKLLVPDQHQTVKKKHNIAPVFVLFVFTHLLVYFFSVKILVECLIFPVVLFTLYLCCGKSACFCSWTWRPAIRKEQLKAVWARLRGKIVVDLETGSEERKAQGS